MCPMAKMLMGETAELLAEKYKISREEQDQFALISQQCAVAAAAAGKFRDEIVPVSQTDKKGKTALFDVDEHVRAETTSESLAKLPPVFSKTGSITAGNSSGITDGASALVLMSGERMGELGLKPLARIHDATVAAVDPRKMGIGPVPAIRKLEQRTGWKLADYSAIELNEAFASQSLAVIRKLELDPAIVNINGGAIALGHPLGCTGCKLTIQLINDMKRLNKKYGIVTACVGGGQGIAGIIENII